MEDYNAFWYYITKLNCVPTLHNGTQCNVSVFPWGTARMLNKDDITLGEHPRNLNTPQHVD